MKDDPRIIVSTNMYKFGMEEEEFLFTYHLGGGFKYGDVTY